MFLNVTDLAEFMIARLSNAEDKQAVGFTQYINTNNWFISKFKRMTKTDW